MKNLILALALAASPLTQAAPEGDNAANAQTAETSPRIESAFSPDAGGEALVLKVIDSANKKIRLAAYSFTSPVMAQALIKAKQRGVDVRVIADYKRNLGKPSVKALSQLVKAGIPTRTVAIYAMHHDKYIVVDDRTVQNGSYNYTQTAAHLNSENVIVHWQHPDLAQAFLQHWEDRWRKGVDYAIPAQ
ncbi:phospholipase D family nuclease [Chitinimonas naiadis]